jgi:alpha-aminoadipate carrier protein LysW
MCKIMTACQKGHPTVQAVFIYPKKLTKARNTMNTTPCPVCEALVSIPADAMQNELIACADCGSELEIISLSPVQLDLAPDVEEDWGE